MGTSRGGFSLRDVVAALQAQGARFYHLGVKSVTRSSLARVNEQQPYVLYQELFGKLYTQGPSFQQILRLLDINLFLRRDLLALLQGKPPDPYRHPNQAVLAL